MRHKKLLILLGVAVFFLLMVGLNSNPVQAKRWSGYYQETDQLTANGYLNVDPAVAVDSRTGIVHMTYTSVTPVTGESDIYYHNNSGTLGFYESTETLISTNSHNNWYSDIAVDSNGFAHIVFTGIPNGALYDAHQVMYTNNTLGTFQTPVVLSWSLNNNSKPCIEVDENLTVHVMWQQKDESVDNYWHIAYMNLTAAINPSKIIGFTTYDQTYNNRFETKTLSRTVQYWDDYYQSYSSMVPMYKFPGYELQAGGSIYGGYDIFNMSKEYRTLYDYHDPANYYVNVSYPNSPTAYEWAAMPFYLQEPSRIIKVGLPITNYASDSGANLSVLITSSLSNDFSSGVISNTTIFPDTTNGTWKYISTQDPAHEFAGGTTYYVVIRGYWVTQTSTYVLWAKNNTVDSSHSYYSFTTGDPSYVQHTGALGLQLEVQPVNSSNGNCYPNDDTYLDVKINGSTFDVTHPYSLNQDHMLSITLNRSALLNLKFSFGFQFIGGYSIFFDNSYNFNFNGDCTDVDTVLIKRNGVIVLRSVFIFGGSIVYFESNHTTGFSQWFGYTVTGGSNEKPKIASADDQVFIAFQRTSGSIKNVFVVNSSSPLGSGFNAVYQVTQNTGANTQSYDPSLDFSSAGTVELAFVNRTTTDADYKSELVVTNNYNTYFSFFDAICDEYAANGHPMKYTTPVVLSLNETVDIFYVSEEKYPTWKSPQVCVFTYTFVYNGPGGSQFLELEEDPQGSYIFESLDISYGKLPADLPVNITIEDLYSGVRWTNVTLFPKEGSAAAPPENDYYHKVIFWNTTEYFISNGTYRLTISNTTNDATLMRVLVDGTHTSSDTGVKAYLVDESGNRKQLNYSLGLSSGANMVCVEWQWANGRVSFTDAEEKPHKVRTGEFNTLNNVDWYDLEMEEGLYYNFTITEIDGGCADDFTTLALFNDSVRLSNLNNSLFHIDTNTATNSSYYVYHCDKTGRYYLMANKNHYRSNMSYQIDFDQVPRMPQQNQPKHHEVFKSFYKLDYSPDEEDLDKAVTLDRESNKVIEVSLEISDPFVGKVEFFTNKRSSQANITITLWDTGLGTEIKSVTVVNSEIQDYGWTTADFGLCNITSVQSGSDWKRTIKLEFELTGTAEVLAPQNTPEIDFYKCVLSDNTEQWLVKTYSNLYLGYAIAIADDAVTKPFINHYVVELSSDSTFTSGSLSMTQSISHALAGFTPIGDVEGQKVPYGFNVQGGYEYFWRAACVDEWGNQGNWSSTRSLIIDNIIPEAPVVQALSKFTTATSLRLTWTHHANDGFGTKYYNVYMSNSPNFVHNKSINMISSENLVTTTTFTVSNLITDAYYFKVTAVDQAGWESEASNEVSTQVVVSGGEVDIDIVRQQKFQVQLGDHLEFEVTNVISENKDSSNRYYLSEPTILQRTVQGGTTTRQAVTYTKGTRLHFWIQKIDTNWIVPVWAQIWFRGPDDTEYTNLDSEDLYPSIVYVINDNHTYQLEVLKSWLKNRLESSSVLYALNYSTDVTYNGERVRALAYTFWEVVEGSTGQEEKTTATFVYDENTGALLEMYLYDRIDKEGYSLKLVDTSLDLDVVSTWQDPTLLILGLVALTSVTAIIVRKLEK
ncbi:MAG: hypothetical protein ACTSU5_01540 [Promethearchaeota archaeon]